MKKIKEQIEAIVNVYKSGNFSKAELLTKKLINNNPKVVFLYNLLGLILVEQKKIDEAIECYEKGITIDPSFGMIFNNLGLLHLEHQASPDIKVVEKFYKKAISLD